MKKLNITKEAFNKSRYFQNKYGKLEYVSESGKIYKTDKGQLIKFVEEKSHKEDASGVSDLYRDVFRNIQDTYYKLDRIKDSTQDLGDYIDEDDRDKILDRLEQIRIEFNNMYNDLDKARRKRIRTRFD